MVYPKLAWREIRKRPGRAILTLLSIVIGVAASISATTASRAVDDVDQTIAGKAALEITPPVGGDFDEKIADMIREVPGVKEVAPLIQRRVIIFVGDHRESPVAMGIDPIRDRAVHDYEITDGQSLERDPKGIILEATFAKRLELAVGNEIVLVTPIGTVAPVVVGLYSWSESATIGRTAMLLMPIRAAQHLFKCPRKLYLAQIVLQPDADEEAVKAEIAKRLPSGIKVHRPG